MGLLDHFKVRRAPKHEEIPVKAVVRPPMGFLSWVMLRTTGGDPVPCIMRRMMPADAMVLVRWPVPTYFDWLGLIDGRASGRPTKANVNYDKPLLLSVMETLSFPDAPAEIVGAMALCDHPADRPGNLELAYLERSPDSRLVGFGTAALALALLEAERRHMAFFLDALIKSNSHRFYQRCGMSEVDGTPWPTVTVRMEFPSDGRCEAFLDSVREKQIIP
ncbi:MAG: hypothetical protein FJZ00_02210 [Candidatus Sericytochromatia bacterium]|uniref:N-acetyltransferase domain-containing protein n=1 Tax=Candidatus Tanganyikabacteria bacterium TaxID=2961651 RepID=A0A937X0X6_9BACT|nr:hypothetical protein [Candidatus Tanganyikabacteria bacterium]